MYLVETIYQTLIQNFLAKIFIILDALSDKDVTYLSMITWFE